MASFDDARSALGTLAAVTAFRNRRITQTHRSEIKNRRRELLLPHSKVGFAPKEQCKLRGAGIAILVELRAARKDSPRSRRGRKRVALLLRDLSASVVKSFLLSHVVGGTGTLACAEG
jgi:hypothetical protein